MDIDRLVIELLEDSLSVGEMVDVGDSIYQQLNHRLSRAELLIGFERILYKDANGKWIRTNSPKDNRAYIQILDLIMNMED